MFKKNILHFEHIPLRGDNYTDQCRVSPGGQFKPGNSFKCLPKTYLGQKIWNPTTKSGKKNKVIQCIYSAYKIDLICQGQVVICTSEGAFVDHLKRRVDPSQIIGNTSPSCQEFCGPVFK